MSDSNRSKFRYLIKDWSGVPAEPAMTELMVVNATISPDPKTTKSATVRADRNLQDTFLVGLGCEFGLDAEVVPALQELVRVVLQAGAGDTMRNGTTEKFLLGEREADDVNEGFEVGNNIALNEWELKIEAQKVAAMSLKGKGLYVESDGATIATTNTPAENQVPANASTNVGAVTIDGVAIPDALSKLNLKVSNGQREKAVVSSLGSGRYGFGTCDVAVTLSMYWYDNALRAKFEAGAPVAIVIPITFPDGTKWDITLPRLKIDNDKRDMAGLNSDCMEEVSLVGTVGEAGYTIEVKVTPAPAP